MENVTENMTASLLSVGNVKRVTEKTPLFHSNRTGRRRVIKYESAVGFHHPPYQKLQQFQRLNGPKVTFTRVLSGALLVDKME